MLLAGSIAQLSLMLLILLIAVAARSKADRGV